MGLGSGIRDPGSGKNLFRIPDPGSRGQKGPGFRIRIRNMVARLFFIMLLFTAQARYGEVQQSDH
jgi:hypothetical protein